MKITFNGSAYPMVLTMGALLDFKRLTGRDAAQLEGEDLEGLLALCYCCIRSASRAERIDFPYTFEEFCDRCTIEELNAMSAQIAAQQAEEAEEAKKKAGSLPAAKSRPRKA